MAAIRAHTVLLIGAGVLILGFGNQSTQAQSIFCPATIPGQAGFALQGGNCTNGTTGAFSNAALASQTLSDLSQSTTQNSTKTTMEAISARRRTEEGRCPDGFARVGGVCQRIAAGPAVIEEPAGGAAGPATLSDVRPARRSRAARRAQRQAIAAAPRPAPVAPMVYKAPLPFVQPGVRFATWAHAYGDYERRTGSLATTAECCTLAGGLAIPLTITAESRTTTGGFLGGADVTVPVAGGGFIFGLLTGYVSTDVTVKTTTISADPALVPNGSSTLKAHLSGASAGAYVSYFNGGFSSDLTFKADFLDLNATFNDLLGFSANIGLPGATVAFAGGGATRLNNYTTSGNVNYKIMLAQGYWFEPTAGFQYTVSDYDASAAALGLSNGHLVRLQGGARVGSDFVINRARATVSVTGLIYENVTVSGGFIQNGQFGNNPVVINDQGKLRGQGILALNLDFGNGVSTYLQGDVRGGEDLFGVGGRAGVRVMW